MVTVKTVQESLVPHVLGYVKTFEAETIEKLDEAINHWVDTTKSLVMGGTAISGDGATTPFRLTLIYANAE